jgi:hypothetical protein
MLYLEHHPSYIGLTHFVQKPKKVRGFVGRVAPHKSSNCVSLVIVFKWQETRIMLPWSVAPRPNSLNQRVLSVLGSWLIATMDAIALPTFITQDESKPPSGST